MGWWVIGVVASALCVGSAEAAGNAEVFDLWSKLKAFDYTVVRHNFQKGGTVGLLDGEAMEGHV